MNKTLSISTLALASGLSFSALAYDGTNCKEPGVCWEPKPGFPAEVAGSKYDPKHDPNELNKQAQSIKEMEARNEKRWKHMTETGKFVYEIEEN